MKKRFTLSLLLLFCSLGIAQTSGDLVIFSNTGAKFYVVLNGIRQNNQPETNVKITGLDQEWYSCKIIAADKTFELDKNIGIKMNMEVTYQLNKHKKKGYQLRYFAEKPFDNNVAVDQSVVVYHATETPTSTQTTTTTNATHNSGNSNTTTFGMGVGGNGTGTNTNTNSTNGGTTTTGTTTTTTIQENGTGNGGGSINMNININETPTGINTGITINENGTGTNMGTSTNSSTSTTTTTTSSSTTINGQTTSTYEESTTVTMNGNGTGSNTNVNTTTTLYEDEEMNVGISNNTSGTCYMSSADFENYKKSIATKDFSDARMTVAKQGANAKCLTAEQVLAVTKLFDFEEDKLEFAKFAYTNCSNKTDYYKVNEAFEFDSSIEELDTFIKTK